MLVWMVIRNSLRVNANVLAFSEWSWNRSTFQRATLNAPWNSLVWMRIRCMRHLIIMIVCLLFERIANDLVNDTGLFAICCVYSSAFYSLMWMHLYSLRKWGEDGRKEHKRNFETNMFWFGIASSILGCGLWITYA